jgi:hypothetical protein
LARFAAYLRVTEQNPIQMNTSRKEIAEKIMNKPNTNKKSLPGLMGLWAVAALAGALMLTTAGVASADYGQGAVYQIELSAQVPGAGGAWLWIALNEDGTGDYAGSDCAGGLNGHQFRGHPVPAASDRGDITGWHYDGDNVVIEGIQLNSFLPLVFYSTITVPRLYGHYIAMGIGAYMTWPFFVDTGAGFSQLQVAP